MVYVEKIINGAWSRSRN